MRVNPSEELIDAASKGKLDMVKHWHRRGANVQLYDNQAIIMAAMNGHTETVKFLISEGADIHAQDDAPLSYAAHDKHEATVRLLLGLGGNAWKALKIAHPDIRHVLHEHIARTNSQKARHMRNIPRHRP